MPRKKNAASNLRKRNLHRLVSAPVREKGMELPVNTLIILVVAVLVVLVISGFFLGIIRPNSENEKNRMAFLNSCSGWVQTGCSGTMPSDLEEKYSAWQPKVDMGDDKESYLRSMCGCYGRTTTPGSTQKYCNDRSAAECELGGNCELKNWNEISGLTCEADAVADVSGQQNTIGFQCPTGKERASNEYKCSGTTTAPKHACKPTGASETNVCKIASSTLNPPP